MAVNRIKLVRGDTRPRVEVCLTDEATGTPADLSGATVVLRFRYEAATVVTAALVGTLIAGTLIEDGTPYGRFDTSNPAYAVPGAGGMVRFEFPADALLATAGFYDGEIECSFPDGSVHTVYDLLKFTLRDQF